VVRVVVQNPVPPAVSTEDKQKQKHKHQQQQQQTTANKPQ